MTAKEMFEKLGYEEVVLFNANKAYRKIWETYESVDELYEQVKQDKILRFVYIEFGILEFTDININLIDVNGDVENGVLKVAKYGKCVGMPKIGTSISLEELKAINKQIEELGWNNE